MFIRLIGKDRQHEVLINVNHISKIEVEYVTEGNGGDLWKTGLTEGNENPETVRLYKFMVEGESFRLLSNPNDPVLQVIEEIYKNAVKAV